MSELKLKPCPFCGGEAWTFHIPENDEYETKLHEWIWRMPGRWLVGCDTQLCMLNINNMPETFESEQEAAEAWNKRVERLAHWIYVELGTPFRWAYRCSNCLRLSGYQSKYCPFCGFNMNEEAE